MKKKHCNFTCMDYRCPYKLKEQRFSAANQGKSKIKYTSCSKLGRRKTFCQVLETPLATQLDKQADVSIRPHQIGPCAVQLLSWAYPHTPLHPAVTLKSQTQKLIRWRASFTFPVLQGWVLQSDGRWSVTGCALQQRYAFIKGIQGGM